MRIIQGVLVSEDIVESKFCCDLAECEGMCCIEGDVGAPVDPMEVSDLEDYYPIYQKYMTPEGITKIEESGTFDYDLEGAFVTPLLDNEACAYVYYENSIAKCAIEKAFLNGEIDFQKFAINIENAMQIKKEYLDNLLHYTRITLNLNYLSE